MFVDVNRPWRHAKVTDQRTCIDFAECMRDLVDEHYPDAEKIRVVLDNVSSHSQAALYQRFDPAEARRSLSRIEFHFTPKHASWLNMVEIEIGIMGQSSWLKIAKWERRRNRERARIEWMFTVDRARQKLGRAYPTHAGHRPSRALKLAA
jgi:DDE superfamily endonuclease